MEAIPSALVQGRISYRPHQGDGWYLIGLGVSWDNELRSTSLSLCSVSNFVGFFFLLSYSLLMRDPLSPGAPQHGPGAPGCAGGGGAAPDPFAAEEQVEQEVPEP